MRTLPIVLAATFLAVPALAQQREPVAAVHCLRDESKSEDPAKAEQRCLERLAGLASRNGDELRLTLADGRINWFTDRRSACEQHQADNCALHRLVAYYPIQKLFVVERNAYESFDVIVVSGQAGTVTRMDAYPHLSPGGTRLVAAAAIEAWDVEKHIAIYYVRKDGLKLEWSYSAKDYELWEYVAWNGDEHIMLKVTLRTVDRSGTEVLATQSAAVRRTIVGWQLSKNVGR
jgi:hypothetical protein